ncbi:MAG TPA: hypothetical protein EYG78_06840 [Sulfurovum sp.]|nr:hypothetical protein [Sulfurovum sp.]
MSLDDKTGDTEYFASTDYNQRLEENAEAEYEQKDTQAEQAEAIAANEDIDTLIEQKDFNALYQIAAEPLSESDYFKLVGIGDKDIHIQLARNENITDVVAERLIGTVYLAHKALLLNPIVSEEVKDKLKERIKDNPTYANLL